MYFLYKKYRARLSRPRAGKKVFFSSVSDELVRVAIQRTNLLDLDGIKDIHMILRLARESRLRPIAIISPPTSVLFENMNGEISLF